MNKPTLAITGTNGIPAQYGGFETLVEYIVDYLSDEFDITVFCSKNQKSRIKEYKGCKLRYLPFSANGWQVILHDNLSLILSAGHYDKVLILNCASVFTIRLYKKYKDDFILNIGGLDWKRSKWGRLAKWYLYNSAKTTIGVCSSIVSDNEGIREFIKDEFKKDSALIEYGGDQVSFEQITEENVAKYSFLESNYALVVARIQSDNNIEMAMKGAIEANYPLVVVGNWNSCEYGIRLRKQYQEYQNLFLLDAIYDQKELNVIRSNAHIYIHGHSGGGTNPSLVEIMTLKVPVLCYNNGFNNYTTENKALFFNDSHELSELIQNTSQVNLDRVAQDLYEIAKRRYTWKIIAEKYRSVISRPC